MCPLEGEDFLREERKGYTLIHSEEHKMITERREIK
jgi:hypothetical protein